MRRRVWVSTPSRCPRTAVWGYWWRIWVWGVPENFVREELESLNIRIKGVIQLRSGRRDKDPAKERPPNPTSWYRWREGLSCWKCDHSRNSAGWECRWSGTWLQKANFNTSANSVLDTRNIIADTRPVASHVGLPILRLVLYPAGTASVLYLQGKPHDELPGLY